MRPPDSRDGLRALRDGQLGVENRFYIQDEMGGGHGGYTIGPAQAFVLCEQIAGRLGFRDKRTISRINGQIYTAWDLKRTTEASRWPKSPRGYELERCLYKLGFTVADMASTSNSPPKNSLIRCASRAGSSMTSR